MCIRDIKNTSRRGRTARPAPEVRAKGGCFIYPVGSLCDSSQQFYRLQLKGVVPFLHQFYRLHFTSTLHQFYRLQQIHRLQLTPISINCNPFQLFNEFEFCSFQNQLN